LVQGLEKQTRSTRLVVGVDLDGVLANQIVAILPRIKTRYGLSLTYDEITEFRLPLGASDLAQEIKDAQETDSSYLLDMPVHDGAGALVDVLRSRYRVVLITARPASALQLTNRWLKANRLTFDDVITAEEGLKSAHGADVLVDDYAGNVAEFVQRTGGLAILLDQPWNRDDRSLLANYIEGGRVAIAHDLAAIPNLIDAYAHELKPPRL
jgi:uncharacterized HAD superfamily protein